MPSGQSSLLGFFERVYLPEFGPSLRARTIELYATTVRHWDAICGPVALREISREHLIRFRDGLLAGDRGPGDRHGQLYFAWAEDLRGRRARPPLKPCTVNKHLAQLAAVLAKAGPAERGNPHGLGLLERVPAIAKLRIERDGPPEVGDDVLEGIWHGCASALLPAIQPIAPCAWWRTLVYAALLTGYRRRALLTLSWSQVDTRGCTIAVRAAADKAGRPRRKRVPVALIERMLRIRTAASDRVFPWPHSESTWYRTWRDIQRAGRIGPDRRIKFHALKAASATRFSSLGASVHAIQAQGDWATITTAKHYITGDPERDQRVSQLEAQLPPCFRAG